jgi:hypothetical protein
MGMPSMTKRESPCPKLRVTLRSSIPFFAHDAQTGLDKVDGDDEEGANLIELDDCFCRLGLDSAAADNELDFPRFTVALTFDDLPGEDDGFKVKDRKVVIVKFLCGM